MEAVGLPAYSPELNPVERLFKELREQLSNQVFESLEALEQVLEQELGRYWKNPSLLVQLTAYPWWREGVQYITTSIQ